MGMRIKEGQRAGNHQGGRFITIRVKKEVFSHGISHTWIVSCCVRCRVAL